MSSDRTDYQNNRHSPHTLNEDPILVPQPSKHPDDPLVSTKKDDSRPQRSYLQRYSLRKQNWSRSRRLRIFATLCVAGLSCIGAPTANQLAYVVQAPLYKKTPNEISYGASASLAGFIAGPFLYQPLFLIFGRSCVLFWGIIAQLLTQVWAARMTGATDYVPFIISRLFSGMLGTLPIIVGSAFILDAFFLHQRGRLFAVFELCFLIGPFVIPTVGGFIADDKALGWPWTFWWTCFLQGVAAVLVFVFVEESNFDRVRGTCVRPPRTTWWRDRLTTMFRGWQVVPAWTAKHLVRNQQGRRLPSRDKLKAASTWY